MEIWFLKAHDANKILHVNFNNCLTVKSVALYKNYYIRIKFIRIKLRDKKGRIFKKILQAREIQTEEASIAS